MAGIQLVCTEQDIEDILVRHCDRMLGIEFMARQFRTAVGVVDILAKHPYIPNVYYVVEIKRGILDPATYVQALRYANWLNSERSKFGRRFFIPIIVGEHLHASLNSLCQFFDQESHYCTSNIRDVTYRLFHFDPLEGVSFAWHSREQEACDAMRTERYCHLNALDERLSHAEWKLERIADGN
jgi:hypothetical protein